ncbi:MAG: class I mannose-6-phosphate isomerase [Anaerolineales bacterium]|nr:class I mannose-6-phosphate isomerase [Anaerolineales bacterium]
MEKTEINDKHKFYPMLFNPILKDYIWGGKNLAKFGRPLPEEGVVAESWEIAAHQAGDTMISNGLYEGKSLSQIYQKLGLDLIGKKNQWAQDRGIFPLLIKLLDASKPLSVQVHPDDNYALEHEGNELGKTEMWVILKAEPEAAVILGVEKETNAEEFRQAIVKGTLEKYLHKIPVQAGDVINVPSGSVHAILEGIVLTEIQQNSNTTYRVYDWNRLGSDGVPRELHIEQGLDVIDYRQVQPQKVIPEILENTEGSRIEVLEHNCYFTTQRVTLKKGTTFSGNCDGESLEIWGVLSGSVELNSTHLEEIQFTLLPASMGEYSLKALDDTILLRVFTS